MIIARAAAALGGITAQAVYIALGVTAVIGGIMFGIYSYGSYRENLANTRWELRMANARIAAQAVAMTRERKRQDIERKNAEAWAAALVEAEATRLAIEQKLSARKRVIVYPKEIIPELNR